MSPFKTFLLLAVLGAGCFHGALVAAQSTGAVAPTALQQPAASKPALARATPSAAATVDNEPAAPALPPATASRAPAMRVQPGWVQREGYVPVPQALVRPEEPAAANALPPANAWGNFATIDPEKPFANDPTGTNVFADTKYAPAAVRAAIEASQNPDFDAPMPPPAGGMGMGGMGMGGGMTGSSQSAMMQQSFAPTAPVAAAPTGDGVFTGGNNAFNNRYTPSVGNAIGSSDLLVQMLVEAPEQDVAKGSDTIRQLMGRLTNTMPNNIFVYQTRTISNPTGQPSTSISFLMKNNVDAERARQQSVFSSTDMMRGFIADVAKATKLKVSPGTIKVSSAVNDGGMSAGPAAAAPGQMPGQLGMMPGAGAGMGPMMMPGQAGMPGAAGTAGAPPAAAPAPAAPAKSSAGGLASGVLTGAGLMLAVVALL